MTVADGDIEVKKEPGVENGAEVVAEQPGHPSNGAGSSVERRGSRFGDGLLGSESSMRNLGKELSDYLVTKEDLSELGNERTRGALIQILQKGTSKADEVKKDDPEAPSQVSKANAEVHQLIAKMQTDEEKGPFPDHSPEGLEADRHADLAANVLASLLLRSSPETGIDPREVENRREFFGTNAIADKEVDSFLKLCWEAVQDFVLIMLIVLGIISIVVEVTTHRDEKCGPCWIEGAAILVSVCIVVFVTAGIDYAKQFAFIRLTRSLHETNTKAVIRDGKQVSVTDDDIVVGDVGVDRCPRLVEPGPADVADDLETPVLHRFPEKAHALEGNPQLDRVPPVLQTTAGLPEEVLVVIDGVAEATSATFFPLDPKPVVLDAQGIDGEHVGSSLIVERVEDQAHPIVRLLDLVALGQGRPNPPRVVIEGPDGEVQGLAAGEDQDFGRLGSGRTLRRVVLGEPA